MGKKTEPSETVLLVRVLVGVRAAHGPADLLKGPVVGENVMNYQFIQELFTSNPGIHTRSKTKIRRRMVPMV